jgi:hypothetical protein
MLALRCAILPQLHPFSGVNINPIGTKGFKCIIASEAVYSVLLAVSKWAHALREGSRRLF